MIPRRSPASIARSERRMTRGQVEIEARIDLHGTGIERSRERLLQFPDVIARAKASAWCW